MEDEIRYLRCWSWQDRHAKNESITRRIVFRIASMHWPDPNLQNGEPSCRVAQEANHEVISLLLFVIARTIETFGGCAYLYVAENTNV